MSAKEFLEVGSEETGGFRFTLLKYLKYWYVFLIGLLLSFLGAYLYMRYSTPIYNVSSTLLIKGNEKENGLSGNAVINDLENFKSTITLDDQVDILKSKTLMQQALTDLALFISYKVDGQLKKKEIYGRELPVKLVFTKLDTAVFENEGSINLKIKEGYAFELKDGNNSASYKFGQEIKKPYGTFTVTAGPGYTDYVNKNVEVVFHEIKELTDDYSDVLSVEIVNKANKEAKVVAVNLSDAVPEKGKDIINKLVDLYNQAAIADKNQVATNTIQFIDERLKYLTAELSSVEKEVEQYKRRNDVTDVSSEASMYLENSSDYRKKLSEIDNELEVLKSLEGNLNNNRGSNSFDMIPTTISIQDPTLLSSIAKYNELQLERERMLRIEQPNSPLVQNVNEQLGNIKQNILGSIRNIKNGLTITRRNLQQSAEKFASQIQKVPQMERELLEVKRQQGIKQELYLYLLQKREESALSLAATTVSSARIIDPAMADKLPISPKKRSVYMLAILLGLGLPFALLYAKNALYDQIQQQTDVTRATNTPILGEISHKKTDEVLVVSAESRTPIAELFRLIRTNLHFRTKGKENKVILVTSSISGEGKTFFAINFAASLAMTGKKVIALDFDLRKPSLLEDLGLTNKMGITDYLTSDVSVDQIITTTPTAPNLYVVGSGPIPHNPAELIMSPKLEDLIAELKEQFDYIIMDTAPVGQVADAFSLNYYSDLMIYLVRYNYTSKSYLKIINDIYENKKFSQPMIVLNDSDTSNSYHYGYGGYGYPEKKTQKSKKGSIVATLKSLI